MSIRETIPLNFIVSLAITKSHALLHLKPKLTSPLSPPCEGGEEGWLLCHSPDDINLQVTTVLK